jgi:hypothetical protein
VALSPSLIYFDRQISLLYIVYVAPCKSTIQVVPSFSLSFSGGAGVAVIAFVLFSPYPALLALFGFFFSLPCFYYIVGKPQYATTGRFVLLSYNLTALFWYGKLFKRHEAANKGFTVTIRVLLMFRSIPWPCIDQFLSSLGFFGL